MLIPNGNFEKKPAESRKNCVYECVAWLELKITGKTIINAPKTTIYGYK